MFAIPDYLKFYLDTVFIFLFILVPTEKNIQGFVIHLYCRLPVKKNF